MNTAGDQEGIALRTPPQIHATRLNKKKRAKQDKRTTALPCVTLRNPRLHEQSLKRSTIPSPELPSPELTNPMDTAIEIDGKPAAKAHKRTSAGKYAHK